MGTFDKILGHNESLIKNDNALDFEFIPPIIQHREKEQENIAIAMKPLFQERSGNYICQIMADGDDGGEMFQQVEITVTN